MVLFDTSTPTSWRVFLICSAVEKGFFLTIESILLSSDTVVFRGLPDLLLLLSSPVRSCFLTIYQTVDFDTPNFSAMSLIDFFSFFSFIMACFTGIGTSLAPMLRDNKCKCHS
uniref:Uncharacterized protein n=1 Tax=Anguilla anguilla TaxID=7936 RepID=A0A0E9XCU9_ANGAN